MAQQLSAEAGKTNADPPVAADASVSSKPRQSGNSENPKATASSFLSNAAKLLWVVLSVLFLLLIIQDLLRDLDVIEPVSVPKAYAEAGYTAEVVSHRLNDALNVYVKSAGSRMQVPSVSARDTLPKFVVPKIGLSLDTIVAAIRRIYPYGNHRTISGELTTQGKLTRLRLRIDGEEVYSSPAGLELENLDELLAGAAPSVMEKIRPYLVAAALYGSDPKRALEKAGYIIDSFPTSDINLEWAHVLKARWFIDQGDFSEAEKESRTAIHLNDKNAAAHNILGLALFNQKKPEQAVVEYDRAVGIDPKYAYPHNNMGNVLAQQRKFDDAIEQYRVAIRIDPNYVSPHINLGNVFGLQNKKEEAIAEYHRALRIDPDNKLAKLGLQSEQAPK